MAKNKTKIIHVDAYDGDCFGVSLSSGHTILLELGSRTHEPAFAALIERGMFDKPKTDGKRLYWPDGPSLALAEIFAMVAQSGGKPQESTDSSTPIEKKKARALTISGAIATVLSGIFIACGIFDAIRRSEYQNIGMNTPVVVLTALIFIAGVAALAIGLKRMKSAEVD